MSLLCVGELNNVHWVDSKWMLTHNMVLTIIIIGLFAVFCVCFLQFEGSGEIRILDLLTEQEIETTKLHNNNNNNNNKF